MVEKFKNFSKLKCYYLFLIRNICLRNHIIILCLKILELINNYFKKKI